MSGLNTNQVHNYVYKIWQAKNGIIYVITGSDYPGGTWIYSSQDGKNFKLLKCTSDLNNFFQSRNGTIYAFNSAGGGDVYYSQDGKNFNIISNLLSSWFFQAQNGVIYSGYEPSYANSSIFYSKNGKKFIEASGFNFTDLYNANKERIFESVKGTIYLSWETINGSYHDYYVYHSTNVVGNFIVNKTTNQYLYMDKIFQSKNGTFYSTMLGGLYSSKDGGDTFNKILSLPEPSSIFDYDNSVPQSQFFQSKNGTIYVYIQGVGLYYSVNGNIFNYVSSLPKESSYKIFQSKNGTIYIWLKNGGFEYDDIYFSIDHTNFKALPINGGITKIFQSKNGNIYANRRMAYGGPSKILSPIFLQHIELSYLPEYSWKMNNQYYYEFRKKLWNFLIWSKLSHKCNNINW